jgi:hypothetical protein
MMMMMMMMILNFDRRVTSSGFLIDSSCQYGRLLHTYINAFFVGTEMPILEWTKK